MKNIDVWIPTKFCLKNNKLSASKNIKFVNIASRLHVNILGEYYSKYIKIFFHGCLLDLGCGNVPLFEAYKDYVDENICVDWGNSNHKNEFVDYYQDLNESLFFESESFDVVLLSDVLEHIRKPEQLVDEINRILKPGGKLVMNVPFFYWIHEAPYDYFRYTEFALKSFFDKKFKLLVFESYGGLLEIQTDILSKIVSRVPIIGKPTAKFLQWLNFKIYKTNFGKKTIRKTSKNFPFGYFIVAEKV